MADFAKYDITIRDFIGHIIGCKVVDITQQDPDEFDENEEVYVAIHFDNGHTVEFPIPLEGSFRWYET